MKFVIYLLFYKCVIYAGTNIGIKLVCFRTMKKKIKLFACNFYFFLTYNKYYANLPSVPSSSKLPGHSSLQAAVSARCPGPPRGARTWGPSLIYPYLRPGSAGEHAACSGVSTHCRNQAEVGRLTVKIKGFFSAKVVGFFTLPSHIFALMAISLFFNVQLSFLV